MKKLIIFSFILIFSTSAYSKHKVEEQNFRGISYSAPGSKNYKKFDTELINNKLSKFVQKQLDNRDKTGLVNYLLFEDNKIIISKKNYNDQIKKNKNLLISNSMGKSLISYVVGHAICKGYIDSVNVKLDDWIVINDTLYADNTLKQVLIKNLFSRKNSCCEKTDFVAQLLQRSNMWRRSEMACEDVQ